MLAMPCIRWKPSSSMATTYEIVTAGCWKPAITIP